MYKILNKVAFTKEEQDYAYFLINMKGLDVLTASKYLIRKFPQSVSSALDFFTLCENLKQLKGK